MHHSADIPSKSERLHYRLRQVEDVALAFRAVMLTL